MRRPPLLLLTSSLLLSLLSLPGCGDPTDGVIVRPQGSTYATSALPSPLFLARGGEATFEVVDNAGLIGNVAAVSSDPKILSVDLVGQELGSGTAYVHTTSLATGPVKLSLTVDGQALTTLDLDVHAVADLSFDLPADGLEAEWTTMHDLSFDARSRVPLQVALFDAAGAPLYGHGLVSVDPSAGTLPCEITTAGGQDYLVLHGAAPGDYPLPLRIDGQPGPTPVYHAIAAAAATAVDYFGDSEAEGALVAGDRACLGVAPVADTTRIFAALADWTLGTEAIEGGPATFVCYTYSPDEKPRALTAKFGTKTVTREVHGARFTLHTDAAALASETPPAP